MVLRLIKGPTAPWKMLPKGYLPRLSGKAQ